MSARPPLPTPDRHSGRAALKSIPRRRPGIAATARVASVVPQGIQTVTATFAATDARKIRQVTRKIAAAAATSAPPMIFVHKGHAYSSRFAHPNFLPAQWVNASICKMIPEIVALAATFAQDQRSPSEKPTRRGRPYASMVAADTNAF